MTKISNKVDLLAAFLIGALLSAILTSPLNDVFWCKEAVRHGAAHFDAKTGAFVWNDTVEKH